MKSRASIFTPQHTIAFSVTNILLVSVAIHKLVLTHHHPKFIVHTRIHSLCGTFSEF